jgi:hypothetical protein
MTDNYGVIEGKQWRFILILINMTISFESPLLSPFRIQIQCHPEASARDLPDLLKFLLITVDPY